MSLAVNRFTLTFGTIALGVLAWNIYVAGHDDGRLTGRVVDAAGRPVAGATVVLSRKTITSLDKLREATTDDAGRFAFDDHGQYVVVLTAEKPGQGRSPRLLTRLWFRNQNLDAPQILTLPGAQGS